MNGAVGGDLVSRGRLSVAALAEPSLSATSSYAWRPAAEIPSTALGAGPSTSLGAGPSTALGAGPSTALGTTALLGQGAP